MLRFDIYFIFYVFTVYLLPKTNKILYNILGAMNSAWKDGTHKKQSKGLKVKRLK